MSKSKRNHDKALRGIVVTLPEYSYTEGYSEEIFSMEVCLYAVDGEAKNLEQIAVFVSEKLLREKRWIYQPGRKIGIRADYSPWHPVAFAKDAWID